MRERGCAAEMQRFVVKTEVVIMGGWVDQAEVARNRRRGIPTVYIDTSQ
jgi:hypothetical protein